MRILVLAQKGDWTACESALKALERSVVENLLNEGARQPLARISDTVRPIFKTCKFGYIKEIIFSLIHLQKRSGVHHFFQSCLTVILLMRIG